MESERRLHQTQHHPSREVSFALARNRLALLAHLEKWLEVPMQVLGLVWLALVTYELAGHRLPTWAQMAAQSIWIIFIVDFLIRITLAPSKKRYLRKQWLTLIALVIPAFRVLRMIRLFRVLADVRGLQLVRLLTSMNRGMKSLSKSMARRGFSYILGLTFLVVLSGAAGILAFENQVGGQGIHDYGTALWWTAMIITTMGSDYWPKTTEGRALCLMLSLYAFAVFGYVTASIATFFIGSDTKVNSKGSSTYDETLRALLAEVRVLREERHRQDRE